MSSFNELTFDTIVLKSPFVNEEIAEKIRKCCMLRQGINIGDGEVVYAITAGVLEGTYDHRISIRVLDYEWVKTPGREPIKVDTEPYLRIEGSVHKALQGHNVFGGTFYFELVCEFMVKLVEKLTGCKLPYWEDFKLERIDVAGIFNLKSLGAVRSFIFDLKNAYFPRREKNFISFGNDAIYVSGSTTTVKFYAKGPEFRKHDFKRVAAFMSYKKANNLLRYSEGILRVEVEVKKRKLIDLFGEDLSVFKLCGYDDLEQRLSNAYDVEVERLMKVKFDNDLKIVSKSEDVKVRLFNMYTPKTARSVLGTWYQLATLGDNKTKENMSLATYYRHKKLLKEAGISYYGSDIVKLEENEMKYPKDFVPFSYNSVCVKSKELINNYNRIMAA